MTTRRWQQSTRVHMIICWPPVSAELLTTEIAQIILYLLITCARASFWCLSLYIAVVHKCIAGWIGKLLCCLIWMIIRNNFTESWWMIAVAFPTTTTKPCIFANSFSFIFVQCAFCALHFCIFTQFRRLSCVFVIIRWKNKRLHREYVANFCSIDHLVARFSSKGRQVAFDGSLPPRVYLNNQEYRLWNTWFQVKFLVDRLKLKRPFKVRTKLFIS